MKTWEKVLFLVSVAALLGWIVLQVLGHEAKAVPLDPVQTFNATYPDANRVAMTSKLSVRGSGTNAFYYLEADPTTGAVPVAFGGLSAEDHNYGVVGASTLRGAAQIGNATGAASFAAGASSAQTLRVVTATDSTVSVQNLPATVSTNFGAPGASTLRAAAELGVGGVAVSNSNPVPISDAGGSVTVDGTVSASNFPATVSTDYGTPTSSTPRNACMLGVGTAAVANANPVPISDAGGSITVDATSLPLPTGAATETTLAALNAKVANDFGATAAAVRSACIPGNASGIADFNSGAAGAQTPRAVLATRHEAVATPLAFQQSNGSSAVTFNYGTPDAATPRHAAMMGVGSAAVSATNPVFTTEQGHTYSDSARNDYTSTNVTTGAWVQLIASTAAAITQLYIDDTCGQVLELGTGGAGAETRKLIIPRGGFSSAVGLAIPVSTRVSLRAITATCSVGDITLTGLL